MLGEEIRRISLSPDQKACVPAYKSKWRKIMYDTTPIDKKLAKELIFKFYKVSGITKPPTIHWVKSLDKENLIHKSGNNFFLLRGKISHIFAEYISNFHLEEEDATYVWAASNMHAVDMHAVDNQVGLPAQYFRRLPYAGQYNINTNWQLDYIFNVLDLGQKKMLAHYCLDSSFPTTLLDPTTLLEYTAAYLELVQSVGIISFTKTDCYVLDRPKKFHFDNSTPQRLHNAEGPAVEYVNGDGYYLWHGMYTSKKFIMHPETIKVRDAMRISNMEVRRAFLERIGWDRVVKESRCRVLHTDTLETRFPVMSHTSICDNNNPKSLKYKKGEEKGELLVSGAFEDFGGRPLKFVRLICPSTGKEYVQRVAHNEERVYAAVARSFGLTEEEYKNGKYIRQGDVLVWWLDQDDERLVQQHS